MKKDETGQTMVQTQEIWEIDTTFQSGNMKEEITWRTYAYMENNIKIDLK